MDAWHPQQQPPPPSAGDPDEPRSKRARYYDPIHGRVIPQHVRHTRKYPSSGGGRRGSDSTEENGERSVWVQQLNVLDLVAERVQDKKEAMRFAKVYYTTMKDEPRPEMTQSELLAWWRNRLCQEMCKDT